MSTAVDPGEIFLRRRLLHLRCTPNKNFLLQLSMPILSIEAKKFWDVMFHLRKVWYSLLFLQTKISSTQGSFVSSLGEICQVFFFLHKTESVLHLVVFQFLFAQWSQGKCGKLQTDESVNGQKDKR